jgi:uncharacterized protein (DUF924 family)
MQAQIILDFWFQEITPAQWFSKSDAFDQVIQQRFAAIHQQAAAGELLHWRTTAQGRLAEIIVLDQFSRNMYRDDPRAFAQDATALVLAQEAIALGLDQQLEQNQKAFLYMPYMHSESKVIHELALQLFTQLGNENNLKFEIMHKAIIDQFGRYPHRNAVLGRSSTPEEITFLQQPNSSF